MSDRYLFSQNQTLLNAIGTELCWGWSPAINFFEFLPKQNLAAAGEATAVREEPYRILIAGAADIRHIFLTLAKIRVSSSSRAIEFFIYEPNLRVHCRHLFFLHLLLDEAMTLAELEDRTAMFLELYGNTVLREITAVQLRSITQKLLLLIESDDDDVGLFNFSEMKSREKDFILEQLKHWVREAPRFSVQTQWDKRLRTEMAERYDNRVNIIDWDFNFYLKEFFHLVKFPEYREWRLTGMAFDYCRINPRKGFEYSYVVPNKTLAHFVKGGEGSYFGDVKYGPFAAIGGGTESPFLKKRNIEGEVKYGNGVVAMHNVRSWWYELLTGNSWPWAEHAFAWDDVKNYNYLPPDAPVDTQYRPSHINSKVFPVGIDFPRFLLRMRERPAKIQFHGAFVGAGVSNLLSSEFFSALHSDGFLVCETTKAVLDAHAEAKHIFVEKLKNTCDDSGWAPSNDETEVLQRLQPEPKKFTTEPTDAQIRSMRNLQHPFHVVFRRKQ